MAIRSFVPLRNAGGGRTGVRIATAGVSTGFAMTAGGGLFSSYCALRKVMMKAPLIWLEVAM